MNRLTQTWSDGSRRWLHLLELLAVTSLGVFLCFKLAQPFVPAFAWALSLAVMVVPLQRQLERRIRSRSWAALISVTVVAVLVLGLAILVGQRLVQEIVSGADLVRTKVESGEWRHTLEERRSLVPLADWLERQNIPATAKAVASWMTTTGAPFVRGSLVEVLQFLLTFYLLFFFLRDREQARAALTLLPLLPAPEMARLWQRVGTTIGATVYGTLAVSAAQGLLGGLMFWWLGLTAPLLWGVMMGVLAVVPVLGAFVIWVPAALFLASDGQWGRALVLAGWGVAVVGTIDNLLRPVLVGRTLKQHTLLGFVSVVGGILLFGSSGLILGPVTLTITLELLRAWHRLVRAAPEVETQR